MESPHLEWEDLNWKVCVLPIQNRNIVDFPSQKLGVEPHTALMVSSWILPI